MEVKWKVDLFNADAEKVYKELGEEKITPEEVVERAKDPDSELHKCFEWDDKKAAYKYRLQQARNIMCNLIFVSDDEKDEVRTFYNLTFEKSEYHPTKLILQKPDEYKSLLEKAKNELYAFQKKYSILKELSYLFEEIDKL